MTHSTRSFGLLQSPWFRRPRRRVLPALVTGVMVFGLCQLAPALAASGAQPAASEAPPFDAPPAASESPPGAEPADVDDEVSAEAGGERAGRKRAVSPVTRKAGERSSRRRSGRKAARRSHPARRAAAAPPAPVIAAPREPVEVGVELPGERAFNRCSKLPRGKRVLKFNFKPDSEVADLVGWISSISCVQFLIPGPLLKDKRVTIHSPQLITPEEAYRLFLGAMESVGLTVEPMGKFLRVVETGRARFMDLPFYAENDAFEAGEGGETDRRYVTRLFRFQHLDAADVLGSLYNQLKGEQGSGIAYGDALIVTDRASLIARFERIVREVDQPALTRERIWMVRVRNTSATDMAARLREIFLVQDGAGSPRPVPAPPAAPAKGGQTVSLRGGSLAGQLTIQKLIPFERGNQLIVVASEQAYQWLLTILKKLDAPIEGAGDGRFHIYYCRHANCDELAATLAAVTGVDLIGGPVARRASATRPAPGAPPPAPPVQAPGGGGAEAGSSLFQGEVRVTFDGATNSLVVQASLEDFQALRRIIDKLDAPRKQVYVEAMILEVLLDKSREVGVAYHGGVPTSVGGKQALALGGFDAGKTLNPAALTGDLVGLAGGLLGPALEASSTRLFGTQVDIPSFGVLVKLLQKNNDVNVLSNPHLLITNNQEGEISVGQRLPFPGGLFGGAPGLGGGAPGAGGAGLGLFPQVSVNREDVSLRMKLVPSVNEHNLIKLDVDVEISDLAAPNFNGLGPATSKRTARTPVFCKDQQTVIIGGLMSDRATESVQKVPFLGDIPILGFFFRSTSKQVQKSNIIIALTPYVISDMDDLRRVAEKKMRERREFMERFTALEPAKDWEPEIDYRRTRGMLEEINRAARAIDEEELALRELRARDFADESTPIELPPAPSGPTQAALRPGAR